MSVVILSSAPGRGSGAERMLEYLLGSERIRPLVSEILAPTGSSVAEFAVRHGYFWQPWEGRDSLISGALATGGLLRRHRPSSAARIIHAWHTRGFEFALLLARAWRLEPTGTLHDHPSIDRHSWSRRRLIHWAGTRLQRVITVSDALREACLSDGWKNRVVTIKNGLPTTALPAHKQSDVVSIGFVGLNARWKGVDLLADAIAATTDLPVHWHLFGDPAPEVRPLITCLRTDYPTQVTLRGYQTAPEIFASIDVLFHPSIEFDPFPTALLEAARAGIPAVASDVGGSREIVQSGRTGLLFDLGKTAEAGAALRSLAEDSGQRQLLGAAARQRFEQEFPLDQMAEHYIQFWRS